MTTRPLLQALAILVALTQPLSAADDSIAGGAKIDGGGFTVFSTGWAELASDCTITCAGRTITGTHVINDGSRGTIKSAHFGPMNGNFYVTRYDGTLEAATAYGHCYRARVEATSSSGASNSFGSGEWCAPQQPPPPPPEIPGDGSCPGSPGCGSPIILDLGGAPYRLTSLEDGVQFDLRNEGERVQVAWTRLGSEIAFLSLDRNGNGAIDNGSELFGNYTPLQSGALADNGFVALAEFDEDANGVIDSGDPVWSSLLLWTDRNHDGWSTPDEIIPIGMSTVTKLATDYRMTRRRDPWGNLFYYRSTFWIRHLFREQGRPYYDVFFKITPP